MKAYENQASLFTDPNMCRCPWADYVNEIRQINYLGKKSKYYAKTILTEEDYDKKLAERQRNDYAYNMNVYIQKRPQLFQAILVRMPICRSCNLFLSCKNFRNFKDLIDQIDNKSLSAAMDAITSEAEIDSEVRAKAKVDAEVEVEETELPFDENEKDFEDNEEPDSSFDEIKTEAEQAEPPKDPNDPGPEAPIYYIGGDDDDVDYDDG